MTTTPTLAPFHFLLTSAYTWATTGTERTLHEAMAYMDKEGIPYAIWYVPVSPDTEYEINFFTPQVPGAHVVEIVHPRKRRKTR